MIAHGLNLLPCCSMLEIVDLMFWTTFAVLSQLWRKLRRKAWEDFTHHTMHHDITPTRTTPLNVSCLC